MGRGRQKKFDKITFELIIGAVIPQPIFLESIYFRYERSPNIRIPEQLWRLKVTFKILSLCGFVNLLIFFYFYRNKMDRAAKGIIMGTFLYALYVFEIFEGRYEVFSDCR
jgi:hypothetical protein